LPSADQEPEDYRSITATLMKDGKEVQKVHPDSKGTFIFHKILPGAYSLQLSHPTWKFSQVTLSFPSFLHFQLELFFSLEIFKYSASLTLS
jgi:hypothetical protein